MTLDEIKQYFGTGYQFEKRTGWAHTNYTYWKRKGYIPMLTQSKLERLTNGDLKADYQHGESIKDVKQ